MVYPDDKITGKPTGTSSCPGLCLGGFRSHSWRRRGRRGLLGRLVQLLLTTPLLTAKRLDALGELGEGLAFLLLGELC